MKDVITKKNALAIAIDALTYLDENTDFETRGGWTIENVKEKLAEMIASIEKAASTPRKPRPASAENEGIKGDIMTELEKTDEPMTASGIAELLGHSTNKVTALLRQLVQIGAVEAIDGKGRSAKTYKIAE